MLVVGLILILLGLLLPMHLLFIAGIVLAIVGAVMWYAPPGGRRWY